MSDNLDDSNQKKPSKEEQKLSNRKKVLAEVLSTEKSYVEGLNKAVNNYLKPIKEKGLISVNDINLLFSNVEMIVQANTLLMTEFEKAGDNPIAIANVFIKMGGVLKIYVQYINNYGNSITTYENCLKDLQFSNFCNEVRNNDEKRMDLQSLLVTPVQRVPRYVLLLKEAIKFSMEGTDEEATLTKAKEEMELVGDIINEKKRESDQIQRVIQIQQSLEGDTFAIAEPSRRFQSEGEFLNNGNKFVYFLFNNLLLFTTPNINGKYRYAKHHILTKEMKLDEDEKNKQMARIIFPREKVLMNFESEEKCDTFKKSILSIEENLANTTFSSGTQEDALKEPSKSGLLMKKVHKSNFTQVYIKLKGNTLFFYDNQNTNSPNSAVPLNGVTITWAETKADIENVIEFTKENDNNFKPFFLHTQKFLVLKSWLKALAVTSVKLDTYVKESYMQELSDPVFFKISCTGLNVTNDDPLYICGLTIRTRIAEKPKYMLLSTTEFVTPPKESLTSPSFTTNLKMDYEFTKLQRLRFVVFDVDKGSKFNYLKKEWKNKPKVGKLITNLGELISNKGVIEKPLVLKNKKGNFGKIRIEILNQQYTHSNISMQINGTNLEKKDTFGKSDPFLKFQTQQNQAWVDVHKTDWIKQDLNPRWDPLTLSIHHLCGGQLDKPFKIQCFDWNQSRKYDVIGECLVSITEILKNNQPLKLVNPSKVNKKGYYDSGTLTLSTVKTTNEYSAVQYIKDGLKLNLILAIDFSLQNRPLSSKTSLHSDSSLEYTEVISALGSIFESYGRNEIYSYGLNAEHSPIFELGGVEDEPLLQGVTGVLNAYKEAKVMNDFGAKTCVKSVIQKAMEIAKKANISQTNQQYFFLAILLPSDIEDNHEVLDLLVQCENLPLSISFIGLGYNRFKMANVENAIEMKVKHQNRVIQRRIASFIDSKNYKVETYERIASHSLSHLSNDLECVMSLNKIVPTSFLGKDFAFDPTRSNMLNKQTSSYLHHTSQTQSNQSQYPLNTQYPQTNQTSSQTQYPQTNTSQVQSNQSQYPLNTQYPQTNQTSSQTQYPQTNTSQVQSNQSQYPLNTQYPQTNQTSSPTQYPSTQVQTNQSQYPLSTQYPPTQTTQTQYPSTQTQYPSTTSQTQYPLTQTQYPSTTQTQYPPTQTGCCSSTTSQTQYPSTQTQYPSTTSQTQYPSTTTSNYPPVSYDPMYGPPPTGNSSVYPQTQYPPTTGYPPTTTTGYPPVSYDPMYGPPPTSGYPPTTGYPPVSYNSNYGPPPNQYPTSYPNSGYPPYY